MASTGRKDARNGDTARIVGNIAAQLAFASNLLSQLAETRGTEIDLAELALSINGEKIGGASCLERQVEMAASEIRSRRLRDRIFPPGLFGDPAWDILLDLFVSEAREVNVSISDACLASAVPMTTALRWVHQLEHMGLVRRLADARDARRSLLLLTDHGRDLVAKVMTVTLLER